MSPHRANPPILGATRPWLPPPIERVRLGPAEVVLAPTPGRGLIELDLALGVRVLDEPLADAGLVAAMGMVLDRGTSNRDARELAAAAEELGGSISTSIGWERVSVSVEGLAASTDALLELLVEVGSGAIFPADEVATAKARRLGDFARRRVSAGALADAALARVLRAPRRDALALAGLPERVSRLDREQLASCHREAVGRRPLVVAAGDFDPQEFLLRLEQVLGEAGMAGVDRPVPSDQVLPSPSRRVVVVDRPEAAQTELRLGQLGLGRLDPRRVELMLLDAVLGGAFGSRINLELRERLGLTYGARSSARGGRVDGTFEIAAAVDTDRTGLAAERTLAILTELRDMGPSEEEIETVRRWRLGTVPYSFQSLGALASRCLEIGILDLPEDDLATTLARLAVVRPDEVVALARELLDPDGCVIVAVGPAMVLAPQLAPLGEVEVWSPEQLDESLSEPQLTGEGEPAAG